MDSRASDLQQNSADRTKGKVEGGNRAKGWGGTTPLANVKRPQVTVTYAISTLSKVVAEHHIA